MTTAVWHAFQLAHSTIPLVHAPSVKYGPPQGFQLSLHSISNLPIAKVVLEGIANPVLHLGLRISLYDETRKRFFGATWKTPFFEVSAMQVEGYLLSCTFQETAWFYSTLQDSTHYAVLEAVVRVHSNSEVKL